MKDLYSENYKTLMKDFENTEMKRVPVFVDWKNEYNQNVHSTYGIYRFNETTPN